MACSLAAAALRRSARASFACSSAPSHHFWEGVGQPFVLPSSRSFASAAPAPAAAQKPGKPGAAAPGGGAPVPAATAKKPAPAAGGGAPSQSPAKGGAGQSGDISSSSSSSALPNIVAPSRPQTLVVQVNVRSYHQSYLDQFVDRFSQRVTSLGLQKPSQAYLPKRTERWTVLRSPHVDKKARDQFERITHKRLLTVRMPQSSSNIELAYRLLRSVGNISAGVDVRAKYYASQGERVLM